MEGSARRGGRPGRCAVLAGTILLAAAVAAASAPRRIPRPPAPPRGPEAAAGLTAGVRETVLPNGLKVLTREVRSAPVVSFQVWYRAGSRNEHTGITGASHLLEHMLFKGTRRYRVGEIPRTLFIQGAEFNAATYYDWTAYYQTLAADRLELAISLEADRMVNSRVDAADLRAEMTVVRSELEGGENDPAELLGRSVNAAAFEAHPYQWPIIGWRSDVENISAAQLRRYYRAHYGPNNAVVVLVGDFRTEQALALIRRYFGPLRRIPPPPAVHTQEPPQRGERRVTVARPGALPLVHLAYRVPTARHPDVYALDLLATLLGTGRASRLYRALVDPGIASAVDADNPSLKDPFLFSLHATAAPGKSAAEVEAALEGEIARIRREPPTPGELQRALNLLEAEFIFSRDSVSDQATQLGYWECTLTWRFLESYLARLRAVTPEDVRRVAERYLVPEGRTVGHFVPTEPAAEGGGPAPGPERAAARVERPARGARPLPLPRPAAAPASATARAVRFRLGNGIRVVVQENRANPTFALSGSMAGGRALEPPERRGVASLTAGMLTRGTRSHTAASFAATLEGMGASLEARAGSEVTGLSGRALSRDLDRVLDLLAEMLRYPTFPPEELERLRRQVLAGLQEEGESPDALARREFNRLVYPEGHPLRLPTLEEARAAVQALAADDLRAYHRERYGPEHLLLVFCGDVRPERLRAALEARLGNWQPAGRPVPPVPSVPLAAAPARRTLHLAERSEAAVMWGHAGGLKRTDPDYYATQVMNMVLGGAGALSSRLGDRLREEQGLVYSVGSFFHAAGFAGPFVVSLGANPANAARAVAVLEAEVRRMRERGPAPREVAEAVAYLTGSFPVQLETNAGLAEVLWEAEYYGLGADYLQRYAERYRSVTAAQAAAAARRHLHPERAVVVLAGTLPAR